MTSIVAMNGTHIDALMPYEHEMFGNDAWTADSYRFEISDTELRHYLAAESDSGTLLGWAGVLVVGDSAEILTIGVVPAAQRQGIATQLLHALLAEARTRGARECFLEVREDNQPARAFYDREGFARTRVRRGYYDNGRTNAVEMRADLGVSP